MNFCPPIDNFTGRYQFLSNFFPSIVVLEGRVYPSVEHAYQAAKTNDLQIRETIRNTVSPGKVKRIGRDLQIIEEWESIKYNVMLSLVRQKFEQEGMKELLLETGDSDLIEGNTWHDNYWGDCMCSKCRSIEGQNNLGKILMQVRNEIMWEKRKK